MRFILFSVFIFLNTLVVTAQTVQQRLDSLFQSLNQDGELSGAFLVADSGKVVFEKYLGFQDASKTERITSNSRFELASVSKQFTAMAIMQLEEQGKLSYEDDIIKYFPHLKFKNVRVKNLLRHTSGIPDFFSFPEKWIDTKKITAGDSGNLFAQLSGQAAIEVYPKNNLELFYTAIQAMLKFSKENDEVSTLTLYQNGQELTFNKVK